jgi:uncharacterized membrane protein YdbT with pleckstrin-like domain
MKYIDRVLAQNEDVLHRGKIHWIVYARPVVIVCIGLFFVAMATDPQSLDTDNTKAVWGLMALVFFFIALCAWLAAWVERLTTEIAVTNRRVILKRGLVWRSTMELNAGKIESVQVDQSIIGRILDFGTVSARGTGAGLEPIRRVDAPLSLRAAIGQLQLPLQARP